MSVKKGNVRIVITLREKDVKLLNEINCTLGYKTYGKAIRYLIDNYIIQTNSYNVK